VDLGKRAAREAASEQRVHLGDAGRERAQPPVLAPQRRLVGLEAARPEEVLQRALPLGRGGCERGERKRHGAHGFDFRCFFAINIARVRSAVNP
jgi:hypothetical protein